MLLHWVFRCLQWLLETVMWEHAAVDGCTDPDLPDAGDPVPLLLTVNWAVSTLSSRKGKQQSAVETACQCVPLEALGHPGYRDVPPQQTGRDDTLLSGNCVCSKSGHCPSPAPQSVCFYSLHYHNIVFELFLPMIPGVTQYTTFWSKVALLDFTGWGKFAKSMTFIDKVNQNYLWNDRSEV